MNTRNRGTSRSAAMAARAYSARPPRRDTPGSGRCTGGSRNQHTSRMERGRAARCTQNERRAVGRRADFALLISGRTSERRMHGPSRLIAIAHSLLKTRAAAGARRNQHRKCLLEASGAAVAPEPPRRCDETLKLPLGRRHPKRTPSAMLFVHARCPLRDYPLPSGCRPGRSVAP